MPLFTIEYSKAASRADFACYGAATAALAAFLIVVSPREQLLQLLAWALLGLTGWTLIEYVLHRFVLHGLKPFSTWHAEHHRRPAALIGTPTFASGALIAGLVFLPALLLSDVWRACALTLGLLIGYLGNLITHHAMRHSRADNGWLLKRRRWHRLHHSSIEPPGRYGVTSEFWDLAFDSGHGKRRTRRGDQ